MAKQCRVQIVQMDEHFLYLPLYFAQEQDFFGRIPPDYAVEVVNARPHTDEQAYRHLMDVASNDARDVLFAICDPAVILTVDPVSPCTAAVLAGLVTNAAFWAIDHKVRKVSLLRDLAEFDKIISYQPGTTSYAIATRIFLDSGRTPQIYPVDPKQELQALKKSPQGWTALSPDILEIEHLLSTDTRFGIDLVLGQTQEYNNVLVTALISRDDVVRHHPQLVTGLLAALQRGLIAVNAGDRALTTWASRRFNESAELVDRALQKARDAQLFPTTVDISEPQWLNAARTVAETLEKGYDHSAAEQAQAAYATYIAPCRHFARKVVDEEFRRHASAGSGASREQRTSYRYFLGGLALGLLIWLLSARFHAFDNLTRSAFPLVVMALLAVGVAPLFFAATRRQRFFLVGHWIVICSGIAAATMWRFHYLDSLPDILTVGGPIYGVMVDLWVHRLSRVDDKSAHE